MGRIWDKIILKNWILHVLGYNYTFCKIKQNKAGQKWFGLKRRIRFRYEWKFIVIGRIQYQNGIGEGNGW